ncbi:dipeptide/tripeptide permease [Streptomyces sp. SLBN-8D4]
MASSLTKDSVTPGTPGSDKTFFGHPRGLATLFMTEMWERFSYYGMRALLPLYLVAPGGLHLSAATATAIYSVYVSLVYLLAMPGGWFGDRVWGPRKTVAVAGAVIMLGHLTLALPSSGTFYAGLGLVAIGSGLLKANISTMVGHLYEGPDDPRRDGGFTVFYMGINLGAFAAPLVIGTIGENFSWHLGFALAAVGMALGLAQFLIGSRHLADRSSVVPTPLSATEKASTLRKAAIWAGIAVVFYAIVGFSGHYTLNWILVPLTLLGVIIPVMVLANIKRDKDLDRTEQKSMSAYIWFFVAAGRVLDDLRPGRLDPVDLRRLLRREQRPRLDVPGLLVPVGQPRPHHGAGPGLRLVLAGAEPARQGAEHGREVRLGPGARRCVLLPVPRAAGHRGRWPQGRSDVAGRDLLRADRG